MCWKLKRPAELPLARNKKEPVQNASMKLDLISQKCPDFSCVPKLTRTRINSKFKKMQQKIFFFSIIHHDELTFVVKKSFPKASK